MWFYIHLPSDFGSVYSLFYVIMIIICPQTDLSRTSVTPVVKSNINWIEFWYL